MTVTPGTTINSIMAAILFTLLTGVQHTLVRGRNLIDRLRVKSDLLGHYLAKRLLDK